MCHQLNKNKIIESNDNSISFKEINYINIKYILNWNKTNETDCTYMKQLKHNVEIDFSIKISIFIHSANEIFCV